MLGFSRGHQEQVIGVDIEPLSLWGSGQVALGTPLCLAQCAVQMLPLPMCAKE